MKTTYTRTLFNPDLTKAKVELYISEDSKYNRGSRIYVAGEEPEDEKKVEFTGLLSWTIIEGGEEADAIRALTGLYDENNEYLVLKFENGKVEIYRNSHVTMFIW